MEVLKQKKIIEKVLNDSKAKNIISNGAREIILLGQNVNAYNFSNDNKKIRLSDSISELEKLKNEDGTANVEDQNKLLNKTNGTKILDVALKNKNIEWMTSLPSFSSINAEMFVKRLEDNIQNQHTITGIGQTHRTKTTLSAEDSNKLLEAVPELEEAPFLNPNTLSTAAINEMLNLNI